MQIKQQQQQENEELQLILSGKIPAPRPPEGCPVCWGKKKTDDTYNYGIFASIPVYLVDGNKYTLICHTAKCVSCGHIRSYGLQQGVYRLIGNQCDTKIENWPEIQNNHIDPDKFLNKVLRSGRGPAYIELHEVVRYAHKHL